jgi:hypothetical protein
MHFSSIAAVLALCATHAFAAPIADPQSQFPKDIGYCLGFSCGPQMTGLYPLKKMKDPEKKISTRDAEPQPEPFFPKLGGICHGIGSCGPPRIISERDAEVQNKKTGGMCKAFGCGIPGHFQRLQSILKREILERAAEAQNKFPTPRGTCAALFGCGGSSSFQRVQNIKRALLTRAAEAQNKIPMPRGTCAALFGCGGSSSFQRVQNIKRALLTRAAEAQNKFPTLRGTCAALFGCGGSSSFQRVQKIKRALLTRAAEAQVQF